MKKSFLLIALLLSFVSGAYAAGWYPASHRLADRAYASDAVTDGSERVFSAEITFNNLYLPDGSILRKIQVYVNKSALLSGLTGLAREGRAASVDAVLAAINGELQEKNYLSSYNREENLIDVPLQEYESITDMYIALGYTGYETQSKSKLIWGLWTNTYVSSQKTVFQDISDTVIEIIATELVHIEGLNAKDIAYIYNLGVDSGENLICSDADSIYYYKDMDVYIHKFIMSEDTLDRTITLYQKSPNYVTYYLMIIAIVALPAGVFIAYAASRKNRYV
jgi:hypothetical protein